MYSFTFHHEKMKASLNEVDNIRPAQKIKKKNISTFSVIYLNYYLIIYYVYVYCITRYIERRNLFFVKKFSKMVNLLLWMNFLTIIVIGFH